MRGYREKCLSEKPERCDVCDDEEDIVVHHIDSNQSNNDIENLLPLCKSCHRKVHHRPEHGPPRIVELGQKIDDSAVCKMDRGISVNMYFSDWMKVEGMVEDGNQAAKLRRVVDMAERFEESQA